MISIGEVEACVNEAGFKDEDERQCAMVFFASLGIGANISRIGSLLLWRVSKKNLSETSWRLRANGIWRGGKVYIEDGEDDYGLRTVLPAMCAAGLLERDYAGKGKWLNYVPCRKAMGLSCE